MVNGNCFGKAICSICYEDLQPIVEDLQVISICGHVFHELCLQQWFEYCPGKKKQSCPICKQISKANDAVRLYFQSVGDAANPSLTQKLVADCEDDPVALRREVKRLESKVTALDSALERQTKDFKEHIEEFSLCKELAEKEKAMKNEIFKEKASLQLLLRVKTEELDKSTSERVRLQERNMALAKELAAFKLVTDVDLDEEEVLKLASFGNAANNKDTIDVLRKSLVMRNRSYKELMAKCNLLGRGEARSSKKLEKAKEKINKLKTRLEELEIANEVKDNEALRALKTSTCKRVPNDMNSKSYSFAANNLSEDRRKQLSSMVNSDESASLTYEPSHPRKIKKINVSNNMDTNYAKDGASTTILGKRKDVISLSDEDGSQLSTPIHPLTNPDLKHQAAENVTTQKKCTPPTSKTVSDTEKETLVCEPSSPVGHLGSGIGIGNSIKKIAVNIVEDVTLLHDNGTHDEPMLNIRKESPLPPSLSNPGNICFSGGLLGPDGSNRYLGKWCKRGRNKEARQGLSTNTGDLIAVGADGKGGRIKVLKSLNQSTLEFKESSEGAKRCKNGAKSSSMQSQGCLQIEHFFGRVSNL